MTVKLIIDVALFCPFCGAAHADVERNGEKWHRRAHTTHRCQSCGKDWDVYVSGKSADIENELVTNERELGRFGISPLCPANSCQSSELGSRR